MPESRDPSELPSVPPSDPSGSHHTRETSERSGAAAPSDGVADVNFLLRDSERPPARVGPYRVVRELGRGGMGTVLLAVRDDDKFHKRVAIKLIKRGMDTRSVLRRFELEKQMLGALNHPNIARVYDAGETEDGRPYFVMDHIDGLPLDKFCDTEQLTVVERLRMFQKICSAVHHAHQNLIVHRDIKPGNILVGTDGEPKLLDFGIAKLLNPALAQATMATEWDRGPMTPEYASPEQVQGQPVSTASDVYALGVLLYELLTGRRPYNLRSRAREAVVKAIIEQEPERPSTAVTHDEVVEWEDGSTKTRTADELARPRGLQPAKLRRWLHGDLDNIVLMALRKSPKRRYGSAEEFAQDIERHLGGKPVKAAPETWVYVAGKFVRRNRIGVAAAAAVMLAVVGGAAAAVVGMRAAQAAQREAVAQRGLAEKRTAQIKEYTGRLVDDLGGQIRTEEGSLASRLVLARTTIAALERFTADDPTDPQVQRSLADSYAELGRLLGGGGGAHLGEPRAAIEAFDKSLDLLRPMLRTAPGDVALKRATAATLLQLGRVYASRGEPERVRSLLQEAETVLGSAPDGPLDDPLTRVRTSLAMARAELLLAGGDVDAAERELNEAARVRRLLADDKPEDRDLQRDLTVVINRQATLAGERGQHDRAVELSKEAVEIRGRIVKTHPDGRAKRDLMTALGALASLIGAPLDSPADAEPRLRPLLERQLALAAELRESERDDRSAEDLARASFELGALELRTGRFDAALALHERARFVALGLLAGDEKNIGKLALAASAEQEAAMSLDSLRRDAEAAAMYRACLPRLSRLATLQPDGDYWGRQVEYVEDRLAEIGP